MINRKRIILILLSLCLLLVSCTPSKPIEAALSTLTSESFEGRLVGNAGNEKAVEFMVNQFKKIGLKPYDENSYLHNFSMETYDLKSMKVQLGIKAVNKEVKFCVYGKDFMEKVKLRHADLSAPITFDPNDANLEEKIIVLDKPEMLSEVRNRARAVLLKTELFNSNANLQPQGTPILQISPELFSNLQNSDVERVSISFDIPAAKEQVNNIIGVIPGRDSSKAIVISAHIDHVGYAGKTLFAGAADNAAGSAVLLETARLLKEHADTETFPYDIVIAALNGEEHGLAGSRALVPDLKKRYSSFYNINIDTLGIKGDTQLLLEGDDNFNKTLKTDLSEFFKAFEYDVLTESQGYMSDNLAFEEAGICAVNIGQADVSKLHSKEDTLSNLDIDFLQKVSKTIADFVIKNKQTIYEQSEESHNTNTDVFSPEYQKELKDFQDKKLKDMDFDEFMLTQFKGITLLISGSNKSLNLEQLGIYYPNAKIPLKIGHYSFDIVRIAALQMDLDLQHIFAEKDKYQLDTKYKRDISSEHFISIQLFYQADSERIGIDIVKEREDTTYEMPFELSAYEPFAADSSFGVYNYDDKQKLVKILDFNKNRYMIRISLSSDTQEISKEEGLLKLYEFQKEIKWEELIKSLFET